MNEKKLVYTHQPIEELAKEFHTSFTAGMSKHALRKSKSMYKRNTFGKSVVLGFFRRVFPLWVIGSYIGPIWAFSTNQFQFIPYLLIFSILGTVLHIFMQMPLITAHFRKIWSDRKIDHSSQLTIRGRNPKKIPGVSLVPGDIVLLKEGDLITADMRVIESTSLILNETNLFGQGHEMRAKFPDELIHNNDIRHHETLLFAGSKVAHGVGKAIVIYTGKNRLAYEILFRPEKPLLLETQISNLGKLNFILTIFVVLLTLIPNFPVKNSVFFLILPFIQGFFTLFPVLTIYSRRRAYGLLEQQDTILMPLDDTLLQSDPKEAIVFVNKSAIELHNPKLVKSHKNLLSNFFGMLTLTTPSENTMYAMLFEHLHKQHGFTVTRDPSLVYIPEQSYFGKDKTGHILEGFFVYEQHTKDSEEKNIITVIAKSPEELLEESTYVWDDLAGTGNRRRYYVHEKNKMKDTMIGLRMKGYHLQGLGLMENEGDTSKIIFLGYLATPMLLSHEYFTLYHTLLSQKKNLILYSYFLHNKHFLAEILGIKETNIIEENYEDYHTRTTSEGTSGPSTVLMHITHPMLISLHNYSETETSTKNTALLLSKNQDSSLFLFFVPLSDSPLRQSTVLKIAGNMTHVARFLARINYMFALFCSFLLIGFSFIFPQISLEHTLYTAPIIVYICSLAIVFSFHPYFFDKKTSATNTFDERENKSKRYFYGASSIRQLFITGGASFISVSVYAFLLTYMQDIPMKELLMKEWISFFVLGIFSGLIFHLFLLRTKLPEKLYVLCILFAAIIITISTIVIAITTPVLMKHLTLFVSYVITLLSGSLLTLLYWPNSTQIGDEVQV